MLRRGQFRYIRDYGDEGSIWQCLWCKNTFNLVDNPSAAKWNFCPMCGRSWFNKLECREHCVPRWYYDRWGNDHVYKEKIKTFSGEFFPMDLLHPQRKEESSRWLIEIRSRWKRSDGSWDDWSEWSIHMDLGKTTSGRIMRELKHLRAVSEYQGIYYADEYRARLDKPRNIVYTFSR